MSVAASVCFLCIVWAITRQSTAKEREQHVLQGGNHPFSCERNIVHPRLAEHRHRNLKQTIPSSTHFGRPRFCFLGGEGVSASLEEDDGSVEDGDGDGTSLCFLLLDDFDGAFLERLCMIPGRDGKTKLRTETGGDCSNRHFTQTEDMNQTCTHLVLDGASLTDPAVRGS